MPEEIIEPILAYSQRGPRYRSQEVVSLIVEPGEHEPSVATFVRKFARQHLVHVRGVVGSGRTAHNTYELADVATAKVLRILLNLGIRDDETMRAASEACYHWRPDDGDQQFDHPIIAAIVDVARHKTLNQDRPWWLRLDMIRDGGKREVKAIIYPHDDAMTPPELSAAIILVPLAPILDKCAALMIQDAHEAAAAKRVVKH